jgi:putative inorganic carbon (HCO3(-)) transporter
MRMKVLSQAGRMKEYLFYGLPAVLTFSRALTEIFLALIVLCWSMERIHKKESKVWQCPLRTVYLVFCMAGLMSLTGTDFFAKSLKEWLSLLEFILVSLIAFETFQDDKIRKTFTSIVVVVVLSIGLDGLFQYFFKYDLLRGKQLAYMGNVERITASFSHPNGLGAFLAMMTPMVVAALYQRSRWLALGALIFLCLPLALTYSRGAWIALAFGMLFYALKKDARILFVLAGVLLAAVFLAPESLSVRMQEIFDLKDITIQTRFDAWKDGWNLFLEKPLLGHGLKSYSLILKQGYTHNCYLQILVEMGMVGLVSFCWILWVFFSFFIRKRSDHFSLGVASGVLAGAVHSFSDTILYSTPTAALFWLLMGLGLCSSEAQKESSDSAKDSKT